MGKRGDGMMEQPLTIDEIKALSYNDYIWIKIIKKVSTSYYLTRIQVTDKSIIGKGTDFSGLTAQWHSIPIRNYGTTWLPYKNKEFGSKDKILDTTKNKQKNTQVCRNPLRPFGQNLFCNKCGMCGTHGCLGVHPIEAQMIEKIKSNAQIELMREFAKGAEIKIPVPMGTILYQMNTTCSNFCFKHKERRGDFPEEAIQCRTGAICHTRPLNPQSFIVSFDNLERVISGWNKTIFPTYDKAKEMAEFITNINRKILEAKGFKFDIEGNLL